MFVDHLLLTVRFENDHEAVKPADDAAHLKAVHQKHRDRHLLLPDAIEETILKILCFLHGCTLLLCRSGAIF